MTFIAIAVASLAWSQSVVSVELRSGFHAARMQVSGQKYNLEKPKWVQQKLRICNAYAVPEPLDIYYNELTRLTVKNGMALSYKQCKDFSITLSDGDRLDFKIDGQTMGTFNAVGLPTVPTSLVLIPRRRTPDSLAMAFDSHAFVPLDTAQVALVDAYRGYQQGGVKLSNEETETDLQYNSVVAVNKGTYHLLLKGETGQNVTSLDFAVSPGETYVAMRVGVDDVQDPNQGSAFPMELMVFPQESSARSAQLHLLAVAALVLVLTCLSSA